ncbi:cobalt-precorrin-7 (C(5))-methyltransferase [Halorubrum saccharovorum]|uniref:cobalt-precorrin-7 (C(5))-methyltransferase n=1 Tax=Halorubrum saccharovorum TaxID=2248 RepID=UPI0009B5AF70|nr:cobalt-precorrin-7 (C(5))-methyltransferase [Halorubrum saccharovorum]
MTGDGADAPEVPGSPGPPGRGGERGAGAPRTDSGDDDLVHAVGIGPGNTELLTRRAGRLLDEADVVVGFETVVDFVASETDAELITCGYRDEPEALGRFAARVADGARGVAVLMGDPNHSGYQFLGKVEAAVDAPVAVVPGISSVQVAASRARTPMEESVFETLHVRGDVSPALARLGRAVGDRNLIVIPRPYDWMPEDIAADLVDAGADRCLDALVCERLTHPDEQITRTDLGTLADGGGGTAPDTGAGGDDPGDSAFSDLSVLVVHA